MSKPLTVKEILTDLIITTAEDYGGYIEPEDGDTDTGLLEATQQLATLVREMVKRAVGEKETIQLFDKSAYVTTLNRNRNARNALRKEILEDADKLIQEMFR